MLLVATLAVWGALAYIQKEDVEIPSIPLPPAPPAVKLPVQAVPSTPTESLSQAVSAAGDGPFVIDVALFESSGRSTRLVETLTAVGCRAREAIVDLEPDRHLHVVFIGGYATRADAEPDLARIKDIAGFADARVIAAPLWGKPQ